MTDYHGWRGSSDPDPLILTGSTAGAYDFILYNNCENQEQNLQRQDGQDTQDEGQWIEPGNGFESILYILYLPVKKIFRFPVWFRHCRLWFPSAFSLQPNQLNWFPIQGRG
jgi:hypothetical protein